MELHLLARVTSKSFKNLKAFLSFFSHEFTEKFQSLYLEYNLSRFTIRAISVFRVKFDVEFTRQAVNFSIVSRAIFRITALEVKTP